MALQKGERCCGKEEGPAGITCCFCMCGQLWAPPATRGWEKQENLFRTPKKQSSLFSQSLWGSHGENEASESRSPGDAHSLGNAPLCQTTLWGSRRRWQAECRDMRTPWWGCGGLPERWVAALPLGTCSDESSNRSHLSRATVNTRDDLKSK